MSCFKKVKEEGEEKRNTFGTHRNVYCLLKTHLPIITNMFLIKNSIIFLESSVFMFFDSSLLVGFLGLLSAVTNLIPEKKY
jgi:hypothetical protein